MKATNSGKIDGRTVAGRAARAANGTARTTRKTAGDTTRKTRQPRSKPETMHDEHVPSMEAAAEPKTRGRRKKVAETMPAHQAELQESHAEEQESPDEFDNN